MTAGPSWDQSESESESESELESESYYIFYCKTTIFGENITTVYQLWKVIGNG